MSHDVDKRASVEQACVDHERDLRAYLVGVLRDIHAADDALQRTMVKAIEAAASVNPEKIRGWLFRIALNEAREIKRSSARRGRFERAVWEAVPGSDRHQADDGMNQLVGREQVELVRKAVERLDDGYRDVVLRRIHKGQTFAEIAQDLDKPLGTVLTWMRRALLQLREMQELRTLEESEDHHSG